MKKLLIILSFVFIFMFQSFASSNSDCLTTTYSQENKFGLKTCDGSFITKPIYRKLIRLGNNSYIAQKGYKYGIINQKGEILVKFKYRHAERFIGKYAKLGNTYDFGIYDEFGKNIVKPKYTKIELLYGKMFLTCRRFKYGIVTFNGIEVLDNKFDDIYMPDKETLRLKYDGEWFQLEKVEADDIEMPTNVSKFQYGEDEYKITYLITNTGIWSGYSALTFADYLVKIFSSISPAYEDTIDELMLLHGLDSISIIMKFSWLPKFPITYAQKYYSNFIAPNNGPLSDVRTDVKKQLK